MSSILLTPSTSTSRAQWLCEASITLRNRQTTCCPKGSLYSKTSSTTSSAAGGLELREPPPSAAAAKVSSQDHQSKSTPLCTSLSVPRKSRSSSPKRRTSQPLPSANRVIKLLLSQVGQFAQEGIPVSKCSGINLTPGLSSAPFSKVSAALRSPDQSSGSPLSLISSTSRAKAFRLRSVPKINKLQADLRVRVRFRAATTSFGSRGRMSFGWKVAVVLS
mmetsp:Transcript_85690/g.179034  ORF Transcript_85690/g.179034 Transcript_85690/m.179034 type:complete len:219 (-) Transcript_85690:1852-2508(-)